jgi:hypothetical protein
MRERNFEKDATTAFEKSEEPTKLLNAACSIS